MVRSYQLESFEYLSLGQVSSVSKNDELLAVGMENGTVRLYQNPVTCVTVTNDLMLSPYQLSIPGRFHRASRTRKTRKKRVTIFQIATFLMLFH